MICLAFGDNKLTTYNLPLANHSGSKILSNYLGNLTAYYPTPAIVGV